MLTAEHPPLILPTHLQTVSEFEDWERQNVHEGSYEFVRGLIIEKNEMKQAEFLILKFLTRLFATTSSYQRGDELVPEMDSYIDEARRRRPDLAYFTAEQISETRQDIRQKTRFAIEILSESESFQDVNDKIQDYFDGGARLVWYIEPIKKRIHVYTSSDESKVYKGSALLSASPVIPGFEFAVTDLFA